MRKNLIFRVSNRLIIINMVNEREYKFNIYDQDYASLFDGVVHVESVEEAQSVIVNDLISGVYSKKISGDVNKDSPIEYEPFDVSNMFNDCRIDCFDISEVFGDSAEKANGF